MMLRLIRFFIYQQRRIIIGLILFGCFVNFFMINNIYYQTDLVTRKIVSDFYRNYPQSDELVKQISMNIAEAIDNDDSDEYLMNKLSLDRYYYQFNLIIETKQYVLNQIDFNQYLLDHQIKTLNMVDYTYDYLSSVNSVSSCYLTFSKVLVFILPIITLLVSNSILHIKPATYNYLMTLPYEKKQIIAGKVIASFAANNFIVFLIVIFSFIIGLYLGGNGDLNYPIVTNHLFIFEQPHILISFWQYLILVTLGTILNIGVYTLISLLLVSLFKDRWISVTISFVIALVPVVYFYQLDYLFYSHIIPLVFDNGHALVTYGDGWFGYGSYCLLLIIVSVIVGRWRYFKI